MYWYIFNNEVRLFSFSKKSYIDHSVFKHVLRISKGNGADVITIGENVNFFKREFDTSVLFRTLCVIPFHYFPTM